MPENQASNTKATLKAGFLQAIDLLLPAIEKGGWQQFTEPNTRTWINRLAKYAYLFGFPEPPFVIRTITKQGEPEYSWPCGSYRPSCREVETVTVNGPYTKEIVGPVELGSDCCQPWHCKAYFALKEWREEVASIVTESQPPAEVSPAGPDPPAIPNSSPVNIGSVAGYASADWLFLEHGIKQGRLSEAKGAGLVQSKPAPCRMTDSQGRAVRTLYHIKDAIKHCSPKHIKEKTRRNPLGSL